MILQSRHVEMPLFHEAMDRQEKWFREHLGTQVTIYTKCVQLTTLVNMSRCQLMSLNLIHLPCDKETQPH